MLIKIKIFAGLLLLLLTTTLCQVLNTHHIITNQVVEPFYDADSIYLGTFYKSKGQIDSTVYLDSNGRKINVLFELPNYKYGFDSLNEFVLDEVRKRVNYQEVNGSALVYILLENRSIRDIRIGKRIGYDRKYDFLIKEILLSTEGRWILSKHDDSMPILFVYLFKMR